MATKGGHLRPGDGSWTLDGSPAHLKRACEASLQAARRRGDRPLPVPPPRPRRALRRLDRCPPGPARRRQDPHGRHLNATIEQIRIAHDVLDGRLVSVQNQLSPAFRDQRTGAAAV